jgi:hypothetical protein
MPLQATSGAASYDAFGGGVAAVPNYIEDVFSTYLYPAGSPKNIVNGIDLAGKGGLVWTKWRSGVYGAISNGFWDTARGVKKELVCPSTAGQVTYSTDGVTAFNSDGFTAVATSETFDATAPDANALYVSWTFRKQPKFFDVVTYTGNGTAGRTVAHNLGAVPGCIIVKCTSFAAGGGWPVYHRSLGNTQTAVLNTTDAAFTFGYWNNTTPTSTEFTLNGDSDVNGSGRTYVAYLFAHNAGGFGLTGTDNVISCGSWTTNSDVNLGYEPQWILYRNAGALDNWTIVDNMRGLANTNGIFTAQASLNPNNANAEGTASGVFPTATGFTTGLGSGTFIYIAIRRGPMKVPTTGTSVFAPVTRTGTNAAATVAAGFTPDLYNGFQTSGGNKFFLDRLRGRGVSLRSNSDSGETTSSSATSDLVSFDMNGVTLGPDGNISINTSAASYVNYFYKRAPQFFDEVCYSGTGTAMTVAHNLAAVPEFIIVKRRSGTESWPCYTATTGPTNRLQLNLNSGSQLRASAWNDTAPTSSVFTVGTEPNVSGQTYVAYLFATCPGVSKVGTYTGTGTTQTINCGFTAGSRFVLIKRTDSTGDWYVWDSARGIIAGNDPYLLLNSTAAEVTGTDYVDTAATGFELTSTAPAAINASGGSFVFLAIS